MSERKGVVNQVHLISQNAPLNVGVACHAIPMGCGAGFAVCAIRQHAPPDNNGLEMWLPDLQEEAQDYMRYAMQTLFECATRDVYDQTLKDMKEDMMKRQQAQLYAAVERAEQATSKHRAEIPFTASSDGDDDNANQIVFPRPQDCSGTWGSAECSLEPFCEDTDDNGGTHFKLFRTISSEDQWQDMECEIIVADRTIPAGCCSEHGAQFVAWVSCDYKRVNARLLSERPYSFSFSLPEEFDFAEHPSELPLRVDMLDEDHFVVCYGKAAVYHRRDSDHCRLHVVAHPMFKAVGAHMITSCLLLDAEHLLLGTAIGCIWNVHPTDSCVMHNMDVLPHVVAVRALRPCHANVTCYAAVTAGAIHCIAPEQAETIQMFRPLDVQWVSNRMVIALTKSGPVLFYDLMRKLTPGMIEPPTDAPNVSHIPPWYHALCYGGKRILHVYYPDGRFNAVQIIE